MKKRVFRAIYEELNKPSKEDKKPVEEAKKPEKGEKKKEAK
jgi:hypothetical protein